MSKIDRQLTFLYVATLLLALGSYVYFEFISPIQEAPLAGISNFANVKYLCEVVAVLMAVGFVYLALRLMVLARVKKSLSEDPTRYAFWARLRWAMLASVIFSGLVVHYLFLSPSTVGCPIIGTISLIFVWPTVNRRHAETNVNCPDIQGLS